MKRSISRVFLVMVMLALIVGVMPSVNSQAATVKMNKKKLSMEVGQTVKLRVQGTSAKPVWSSSDTSVVVVKQNGRIKAKDVGTATVLARVNSKTYSCKVTVTEAFELDEEDISEILSGRTIEIFDDEIQIDEEEITEVEIKSQLKSRDNKEIEVEAEVEIERNIATIDAYVTLSYESKKNGWKLVDVYVDTEISEWTIEGNWQGEITVYNSARSFSEDRDISMEIDEFDDDGFFSCEATFAGKKKDVVNMSGRIDLETGECAFKGLDFVIADSDIAKGLQSKGKVFSIYAVPDFANDAFVTNYSVELSKCFTTDLELEMIVEDEEDEDEDDEKLEYDEDNKNEEDFEYEE